MQMTLEAITTWSTEFQYRERWGIWDPEVGIVGEQIEETSEAQGMCGVPHRAFGFIWFRYESPEAREVVELAKCLLQKKQEDLPQSSSLT